ncbi:MAG: hypothetical protein ACMZ66_07555 [Thalassospira sp.]|uniref:hypothetical protein n=1 Tax=Thalassospira sp. TaxID=1912094 RepID=UPI003A87916E
MDSDKEADPLAVLRGDLLRDLPGDIKRVRNAYRRAAQQAALMRDAKDFTAHQAACKAGLSHLDSLIKLLRWASEGAERSGCQPAAGDEKSIDQLIAEARRSLQGT